MKKLVFLAVLCPAIFMLISCDPLFEDKYFINNQSEYPVKVNYSANVHKDTTINIIISPHTNKEFFGIGGQMGAAKDYGDQFLTTYFNEINISINDSLELMKDYNLRTNWQYSKGGKGGGISDYIFTINNSDIQKKKQDSK